MRKILSSFFVILIISVPVSTHAVVSSINGQTAFDQFLTTPGSNAPNSMHMEIIQQGNDVNRFRWDGTPWRIDQGGLGISTAPAPGLIPVGNGSGYTLTATSSLGIIGNSPGGSNTAIQFNDDGVLGGSANFLFNSLFQSSVVPGLPAASASGVGNYMYGLFNSASQQAFLALLGARDVTVLSDDYAEYGHAEFYGGTGVDNTQPNLDQLYGGGATVSAGNIRANDLTTYSNLEAGSINLLAGLVSDQTNIAANGASVDIGGGAYNGNLSAGSVTIKGGDSETGTGGSVNIIAGTGDQSETAGTVSLLSASMETSLQILEELVRFSIGNSPFVNLSAALLTSERTFNFPDFSGTLGLLEADQEWLGVNSFSQGANATTTISIGEIGDATSFTCFNTKNTLGDDISFYFVGTTMVVEHNVCK